MDLDYFNKKNSGRKKVKASMSVRTAKEKLRKIFTSKRPPMKPPMKGDSK